MASKVELKVPKKSFKDFENEMEDYEPVEEEEVIEAADLPVPAFGELDYYRDVEGEHQ